MAQAQRISTVGSTKVLDLTATKDRLEWWTYFGYDGLRRKIAETNANGVTGYGYCDAATAQPRLPMPVIRLCQFVTRFSYDFQRNRTNVVYPDATVTNWYDPLGRLTKTADAWGYRLFHYDNLSRLTNIASAYGSELTIVFDVEDRPLYMTDANGVSVTNTFDVLDRVRTRTYPDGGVERFGYSARGLIAYTNQLGATNFYAYDEAARKIFETNANAQLIQFRYDPPATSRTSLMARARARAGITTSGRVTNKLDQVAGNPALQVRSRPPSSQPLGAAKGDTKYKYDPVGNLTNVDYAASMDVKFSMTRSTGSPT
jgi:YD repeat-containing protein